MVFRGKLTAAIKLLDKENSSGLLNLSDEVLAQLTEKHPVPPEIEEECLLHGPVDLVPPGIFDLINEQRIFDSVLKTKGSASPSGMDAELYRRLLSSKNFVAEGKTLREEIATLTRNLLKFNYHPFLLEGYTACRLIPLDKNPGVRPIGVGEVLRHINTLAMFKEEIKEAVGPLQVCAGHSAGSEAAIHAMNQGPVPQKPINANLRLKINQAVYFSTPKCCSTQIFGRTLHEKTSILKNKNNVKQKFTLILD